MKIRSILFAIVAVVAIVVIGCQKDPLFDTTKITTKQISSITGWSAVSGGEVSSDGTPTISKRGVCWSTSPVPTINDYTVTHPNGGLGKFSVTMNGLSENTTYYVRAFAWNSTGAIYGEEKIFITQEILPSCLSGVFSVSNNKTILFSKGNLQYQASTKTWRFAEHQYDIIGSDNSNISSSYSGWIDLFGWGTSGWNSGANAYQPYSTSKNPRDYYPGGDYTNNLNGSYANADWGVYNKISNGGIQAGQWRTLTNEEWSYLFYTRADASSKKGFATVNNVKGLVLLPDDWTLPTGVTFTSGASGSFAQNTYLASDWSKMEANGAVFLPAAGYRLGTDVYHVGSYGYCWSSSAYDYYYASCLSFDGYGVDTYDYRSRYCGRSVRLVYDAN